MLRTRLAVSVVAVAATVAFGTVAAAGSGDDPGSAPPSTQPRPTAPPLTAPSAPASTAAPTVTAPASTAPAVPPTVGSQEPGSHAEVTDDATTLSPESRAAVLASLGFDETSFQCVASSFEPFVTDDAGAVATLQGCGVPIASVAAGAAAIWTRGQQAFDASPTPTGTPADQIPVEDALVVGLLFLVAPDALDCLARDLSSAPVSTDDAALAVLDSCGVSVASVVSGAEMALSTFGGSSATTLPAVTTLPSTAPPVGPSTTAAAPPSTAPGGTSVPVVTGVPLNDPAVGQIQELFADQGITLTAEQASCIAGGLGTVDTDNMASMAVLLDSCQVF